MVAVSGADRVGLTGLAEFLLGVLAHSFQQPVSHSGAGVFGDYQGFVHQAGSVGQVTGSFDLGAGADGLGGLQIKPVGKHRQPAEQDAFGFGEQRV